MVRKRENLVLIHLRIIERHLTLPDGLLCFTFPSFFSAEAGVHVAFDRLDLILSARYPPYTVSL